MLYHCFLCNLKNKILYYSAKLTLVKNCSPLLLFCNLLFQYLRDHSTVLSLSLCLARHCFHTVRLFFTFTSAAYFYHSPYKGNPDKQQRNLFPTAELPELLIRNSGEFLFCDTNRVHTWGHSERIHWDNSIFVALWLLSHIGLDLKL